MGPLLIAAAGAVALVGGALVLRTFGPAYRVARLLATTPLVDVETAVAAAGAAPRYLGVRGRIDSDDDFPDEHQRPLVFRLARLQVRRGGTWRTVDEERRSVPFEIRQGISAIAVDPDALEEGLVVIPRESNGVAADVAERLPAGTPGQAAVRYRIEQVSAVEHAVVLGVPEAVGATAILRPGLGRPLVLTTLETDEAMRILAAGRRRRPALAAGLLVGGLGLVAVGLAWGVLGSLVPRFAG